jgi:hypothetical protein
LAFSLMVAVRVRGAVRKRTSRIMNEEERNGRSLQNSSAKAVPSFSSTPRSTIRWPTKII